MKSKIRYTDEPMGKLRVVKDFLPAPDKLILKEENVKVTIALVQDWIKKDISIVKTVMSK